MTAPSTRSTAIADDLRRRCTFPTAGPVTCAVSGGADSLAMLALAVDAGLEVTAVHVDHGLRAGSAAEADVVASAAADLGARFQSVTVSVVDGPDLESRARRARHAALPPGSLLGHTADDQAETVLLALLRGTGLDGVAGIAPERHPILGLRRTETEAICTALGLTPVDDPTNRDPRFRRNRVRHEVIPLLDAVAERDVVPLLCRFAGLARADSEFLDGLAAEVDATSATALSAAPGPLARRALRRWLRDLFPDRHPPDAAGIARVLDVAVGSHRGTELAGGVSVRRTRGRLRAEVSPGLRSGQPESGR